MAPYNDGSFYVQESNEDLTRDHYLSSDEFSLPRKIPMWSDRESNPRFHAQRQGGNQLSHPTPIIKDVRTPNSTLFDLLPNFYLNNVWYATSESVEKN